MPFLWNGPCGDPTCYRGAEGWSGGGGAIVYKDGPCQAATCHWPLGLTAKPHYTDNPTPPIVDAGKVAREEALRAAATFSTGEWLSEMGDIVYDD